MVGNSFFFLEFFITFESNRIRTYSMIGKRIWVSYTDRISLFLRCKVSALQVKGNLRRLMFTPK